MNRKTMTEIIRLTSDKKNAKSQQSSVLFDYQRKIIETLNRFDRLVLNKSNQPSLAQEIHQLNREVEAFRSGIEVVSIRPSLLEKALKNTV